MSEIESFSEHKKVLFLKFLFLCLYSLIKSVNNSLLCLIALLMKLSFSSFTLSEINGTPVILVISDEWVKKSRLCIIFNAVFCVL